MDFLVQSSSQLPRWDRSVQLTRLQISHAWAPLRKHEDHGLINYIDTKAKCRHQNKLTWKGT
jgi:hypothetical protein